MDRTELDTELDTEPVSQYVGARLRLPPRYMAGVAPFQGHFQSDFNEGP